VLIPEPPTGLVTFPEPLVDAAGRLSPPDVGFEFGSLPRAPFAVLTAPLDELVMLFEVLELPVVVINFLMSPEFAAKN
jgi:hypothetical protein